MGGDLHQEENKVENLNLRTAIKRTLTYSEVTVCCGGESQVYTLTGETTAKKELKKVLNKFEGDEIPVVTVKVVSEKRAMALDTFIEHSVVIDKDEQE